MLSAKVAQACQSDAKGAHTARQSDAKAMPNVFITCSLRVAKSSASGFVPTYWYLPHGPNPEALRATLNPTPARLECDRTSGAHFPPSPISRGAPCGASARARRRLSE